MAANGHDVLCHPSIPCTRLRGALPGIAHLNMLAIVASSRQLYAPECDGALQRHLDGCLLHTILPVESCVARGGGHTAEIPLDCGVGGTE